MKELRKYRQEPVFWIGLVMTAIGSIAIFIGEVDEVSGRVAVPAALLTLRAFLLIGGADLRSRGQSTQANLWTFIAAGSALIYCALIYFQRWMEPIHVGLQSLNVLLIGVELYVGMLRAEPVAISQAKSTLSEARSAFRADADLAAQILANTRARVSSLLLALREGRAEANELKDEVARLRAALDRKSRDFDELVSSSAPAFDLYAKIKTAGVLTFRSGRHIAFNGPGLLRGDDIENCITSSDTRPKLESKIKKIESWRL